MQKDPTAASKSFQAACDAGNVEGCGLLGVQYLNGEGVSKDGQKARPLLEKGCPKDAPDLTVCVALASAHSRGIGGKASPARAYELANATCAKDVADGCALLGDLTEFGIGTDKNPHAAAKLYQKGCSLGSRDGCVGAAALAVDGVGDAKRSVDAVKKLCDEEHALSCVALGRAYQSGKGVAQDRDKAYALYAERCQSGTQEACARQGYMHLTGVGAEKSESKGKQLISAACTAGEPTGCFFKTRFAGISAAEKLKLLKNACDGHQADACKELKK
jgi:TPR repeat protein